MSQELKYSSAVFDVPDQAAAKRIILTPEFGETTDERWERETPHLVDIVGQWLTPRPEALLIDYGCGIGRLSKALIERFGCRVLGVDISASMRALAPDYVGSEQFSVASPEQLDAMVDNGLRADGALAVWVLQHVLDPGREIALLHRSLRSGASVFVLNLRWRSIPTIEGQWANDGKNVDAMLRERFERTILGKLSDGIVPPEAIKTSFCGIYRKRD